MNIAGARSLRFIKLLHTLVWAFFASAVILIPICAWSGHFTAALILIAVVMVEVLVLAFNGMRCPMTAMAAQYTDNRRHNFDIYLPEWLARENKKIFGSLYLVGIVLTAVEWIVRTR